jgi:hypothetical protein
MYNGYTAQNKSGRSPSKIFECVYTQKITVPPIFFTAKMTEQSMQKQHDRLG